MLGLVAVDVETGGPDFLRHPLLSIGVYTVLPHGQAWGWGTLVQRDPAKPVELEMARRTGWKSDDQWKQLGAIPVLAALTQLLCKMEWLQRQWGGRMRLRMLTHNDAEADTMQFLAAAYAAHSFTLDDLFWWNWECGMAALAFCRRAGLVPGPDGQCNLPTLTALRTGRPPVPRTFNAATDACELYLGYEWLLMKCSSKNAGAAAEQPLALAAV